MQLDLLNNPAPRTGTAILPNGREVTLLNTPPKPGSVYPSDRYVLANCDDWQYPHIIDREYLRSSKSNDRRKIRNNHHQHRSTT